MSTYYLLRDARTRSDKVIAIDAVMHLEHDAGGVDTLRILGSRGDYSGRRSGSDLLVDKLERLGLPVTRYDDEGNVV